MSMTISTDDFVDATVSFVMNTDSEWRAEDNEIMWESHTISGQWYSAYGEYGEPCEEDPFGARVEVRDWDTVMVFRPAG